MAGEAVVIVATPAALAMPLPPPAEFRGKTFTLTAGDRLDRELLIEALELAGYERVDTVAEVGQWSVRGGIVDMFSPTQPSPARLEFFGDEVESIRLFDPTQQRSTAALDELVVLPSGRSTTADARLLTYLPATAPRDRRFPAPAGGVPGRAGAPTARGAGSTVVRASGAGAGDGGGAAAEDAELVLDANAVPGYAASSRRSGRDRALAAEGFTRAAGMPPTSARPISCARDLREHELEAAVVPSARRRPRRSRSRRASARRGFLIPALGLVVLTESEIFGARRRSLRRPKYQRGASVTAFTDLAVGDLVVHEDHGIGRYLGLKTMPVRVVGDAAAPGRAPREADFLLLEYAEGNQLYLPVERLDLISKYLGGDETAAARLDRLGGASGSG